MGCVLGKGAVSTPERTRGGRKEKKEVVLRYSSKKSRASSVTKTESNVSDGNRQVAVSLVEEGEVKHGSRRHHRQGGGDGGEQQVKSERRNSRRELRIASFPRGAYGEQVAAGWPSWLSAVAGEAIDGWIPRRADGFEKISKIGQGTYSNVYKARDAWTGKIVALKKVRFDSTEPESVKFMAREINILRRLDHPNIVKLEGLATSRMSCSLYLVFEYMEHDLAGLAASPSIKFTEAQVKCYMTQLLSGLEHCHNRHVLHRDIKGSNLLLDNSGILKIADFGLASKFDPNHKHTMTSRVVTLWYRAPELLMGSTDYGVGIDLWSAGCILAELLYRKPIMPGRTEVEQLHKIFKLCGSPPDDYWKKYRLPHASLFKPQQQYKRCIVETFKDFPPSSFSLLDMLLSIDPAKRQTSTAALGSEFFTSEPYACDPSNLPQYPPTKEMDAKLRDEEARRLRMGVGKGNAGAQKKPRTRDRAGKALPAPEANAELQTNIDRMRLITRANAKSKSEKFPPPHKDGTLGFTLASPHHLDHEFQVQETSLSTGFPYWSGPLVNSAAVGHMKRKKQTGGHSSRTSASATKEFHRERNIVQIK